MSRNRWSIVLMAVALAIDVTAVVVLVPVVFGPATSHPSPTTQLTLPLIAFSLALIALSLILRRQSKAVTSAPDELPGDPGSGSAHHR